MLNRLMVNRAYILPLAILAGIAGYFAYTAIPALDSTHQSVHKAVSFIQPALIFVMLFITYCTVRPRDLRLARWHAPALLMQVGIFAILCPSAHAFTHAAVPLQSAMLLFICPTATAAAVITAKLRGNVGTLTTYTILINIAAALLIPLAGSPEGVSNNQFSMVNGQWSMSYGVIALKVFPLLVGPLLLALALRALSPRITKAIAAHAGIAFYIWAFSLTLAIAVSMSALMHSRASLGQLLTIAAISACACAAQFAFGHHIGRRHRDTISATQACGQKNTILAIWIGYTFLNPLTSLAGAFYAIWHNLYNSWQLRQYARREDKV